MGHKKFRDITTAIIVLFNIIAGFGSLIMNAIDHQHVGPTFLWIISSTMLSVSRFGYSRSTRGTYIKVIDMLGITVNVILLGLYVFYNI